MIQFVIISIVMISLGFICESYKKLDKYFLIFFCFMFCLMSSLRASSIGNDTRAYKTLYSLIAHKAINEIFDFSRFEYGYVLFNKILSFLSYNPQILLIITSIFIYLIIFKFIKKYSYHYWFSITLFFINGSFRFSLSAIRQVLAIGLLIIGYSLLKKNRYIYFFLIALIGINIHESAKLAFFSLLLINIVWKKKYYIIGLIITFLLTLSSNMIYGLMFNTSYSRYVGSIYDGGTRFASILLFLLSLINISIIFFAYKGKCLNNDFFKITFIRFCFFIMALRINMLDRFADYYFLFEIIALTDALGKYKTPLMPQLIITYLLFIYTTYSYIWGVARPAIQMVWPYKTFWME